jgi:plastocyanin
MRRVLMAMIVLPLLGLPFTLGPRTAAAAQTWTVLVGGNTRDWAVVSNAYHPRVVEIAVGDTVKWEIEGFHTVTFLSGATPLALEVEEGGKRYLNPQVFFPVGASTYDGAGVRNSGVPKEFPKPSSYQLTFTKAGTYQYSCAIHGPGQSGTVVVGTRARSTPAAVLAKGKAERQATLKAGQAALARLAATRAGNEVIVPMIGDGKAGYSLFRYTRSPLTVKRGTTVTWVMKDPFEIHTVTFFAGARQPELIVAEPQPGGPPRLRFHEQVVMVSQTQTYDGRGLVNSGILFPEGTPPALPKRYSLTFTKPGRYEYVCQIHTPVEQMKGVIVVQ